METNPLSLIIKEKTLGNLVTNAKDIKAYVEEKLKEYSVDNYAGDAKQAAKDKAAELEDIIVAADREALETELDNPTNNDAFYGKVDCLLTEVEELIRNFKSTK